MRKSLLTLRPLFTNCVGYLLMVSILCTASTAATQVTLAPADSTKQTTKPAKPAQKASEAKSRTPAPSEDTKAKNKGEDTANKYVRVLRENTKGEKDGAHTALQTSITRFHSADGTQHVDLIGAVHIGEKSYYRTLNRRFREYDAMLYELVAPEGTRVPKGGGEPSSTVGYVQSGMTQMLGLAYQLQEIDYSPNNFVHADMTPDEFSASMKRRKESLAKMIFRAMGQSLVQQSQSKNGGQEAKMLAALMSDNREHALRCVLADQFSDMDGATMVFGGPDGSTLITERNKKALRIMKEQMDAGKKKIAIFYGAGHLDDMGERLIKEFKMREGKREWLTAWELKADAAAPAAPGK